MDNQFDLLYQQFSTALSNNELSAGSLLSSLANAYSEDEKLQTEAQLLSSFYKNNFTDDQPKDSLLKSDMLALANQLKEQLHMMEVPFKNNFADAEEAVRSPTIIRSIETAWLQKRKPRETVFTCTGISKRYPRSNFELKDISLSLKAGEITGLVGENANGKSTLLKIIAGEMAPDKGSLSYGSIENEQPFNWGHIKNKIAYLPQELVKFAGSVKKMLQYSAALHGIYGAQNDYEVRYIINRLGLTKYENANWDDLSGGYKLRFALAKTLVWKPKLLVLDEPLANLDINTQIKVLNDLRNLCQSIKDPIAVILSSQNIEEVEAVSDNMVVLINGEMRYNNTVARIGEDRKENLYEFKTTQDRDELDKAMQGLDFLGLDYNGFSYFIKVPLSFKENDFLKYCTDHDIGITYFNNIGISTKKIVVQTSLS